MTRRSSCEAIPLTHRALCQVVEWIMKKKVNGCVCCHPQSVDIKSHHYDNVALDNSLSHTAIAPKVCCCVCGNFQFLSCVQDFVMKIKSDNMLLKKSIECVWYCDALQLDFGSSIDQRIKLGTCCSLPECDSSQKSTISKVWCYASKKISRNVATDQHTSKPDSTRNSIISSVKKELKSGMQSISPDIFESLYKCHHHNATSRFHPKPPCVAKISKEEKIKCNTNVSLNLQHSGCLLIPSHQLAIESLAHNKFLHVDVHALAPSKMEASVGIPHAVLSQDDAARSLPKRCVFKNEFEEEIVVLKSVPSPESPCLLRDWELQITCVDQMIKTDTVRERKGLRTFCQCEICNYRLIGSGQFKKSCHATLVVLRCNLETCQSHKLALFRIHSMINGTICNSHVSSMLSNIRLLSGRGGYEVVRRGGSSGVINGESHRNLKMLIQDLNGLLPRKGMGCLPLYVPGDTEHSILYRSVRNESSIAVAKYGVPREGGSFDLIDSILSSHGCLGEFAYCKMMTVSVLLQLNNRFQHHDKAMVAYGPTNHEWKKVLSCRPIYSLNQNNYYQFIRAYVEINSTTLVSHNVGLHDDTFNEESESLENKILFVDYSRRCLGRSGALMLHNELSAVLDWNSVTKSNRSFLQNNESELRRGGYSTTQLTQRTITQWFERRDPLYQRLLDHRAACSEELAAASAALDRRIRNEARDNRRSRRSSD